MTTGAATSLWAVIPTGIRQVLDRSCAAIAIGDTSAASDFTSLDDTVAARLVKSLVANIEFGRAYNAASDKAVSVAEMIDLVVGLAGCREPVEHDSDRLRAGASKVRSLLADSGRVSAVGWQPRVNLCDRLTRTIAWWRSACPPPGASRAGVDHIMAAHSQSRSRTDAQPSRRCR
jgi:UDP-glucose 4-epimerase